MTANPEAARASGLSAAEAGAGGTADPLYDVRDIFTTVRMTTNQRDGMINAHNLPGMDDFDYIRFDDARSFITL